MAVALFPLDALQQTGPRTTLFFPATMLHGSTSQFALAAPLLTRPGPRQCGRVSALHQFGLVFEYLPARCGHDNVPFFSYFRLCTISLGDAFLCACFSRSFLCSALLSNQIIRALAPFYSPQVHPEFYFQQDHSACSATSQS